MSTTLTSSRTILRHRLGRDVRDEAFVVAIAFALSLVITGIVAIFADVLISGWDIATQLTRWYAGGLGVYLTAVYLPMYIVHGHTRRAFLGQLPVAVIAATLVLAGLVTVGYLVEHLVYRVAGWEQGLTQDHLFGATTEVLPVFGEFGLLLLAYLVGGTLAGAAFYRHRVLGFALVPVLLVVAGLNEATSGSVEIPFVVERAASIGVSLDPATFASAAIVSVTSAALMGVGTWLIARDLPVRPPST